MNGLPLLHRIAGTRVVLVGEGEMAMAKRRLIERAGGSCVSEAEAHYARLAFVALEDANAARAVALRLKRLGLLVNVADRPDLCDFTTPSILERGPVLVAVSTGGASAGLAKQLRLALERILPQSLGDLAERLATAREAMRVRWPDAGERRRALDAALDAGGRLDPLDDAAAGQVDGWLKHAGDGAGSRTVEIVLSAADPEELTLRQARLMGTADAILHDRDVPAAILARARADARRIVLPVEGSTMPMDEEGLTVVIRMAAGS